MKATYRKSTPILGAIVVIVGLAVIFGWITHNPSITQIVTSFPPMQFNTALCFLLLGLACIIPQKKAISCLRCIFSFFVLLIAVSTLLEYLFNLDLHIDELFILQSKITNLSLYPGRMSPNTAACFSLLSIANISPIFQKYIPFLKTSKISLTIAVFILSLMSILGYLSNNHFLFSWGIVTGMALHTALCFLMLSASKITFKGFKSNINRTGIVLAAIMFNVFFISWLYSIDFENQSIKKDIKKDISIIHTNLNIEYNAIERLYKRLQGSSYSSEKAILADFKAYANDYPSIYFIYDKKATTQKSLFYSNYDVSIANAEKIIPTCNKPNFTNKTNLICIDYSDRLFYVVFKPNLSHKTIESLNYYHYNLEIYLNGNKIFSNLKPKSAYSIKITSNFGLRNKWIISTYLTETEYEKLQDNFPAIYFIFGVIVSIIIQALFYSISINLRKNKVLNRKQKQLRRLSSVDPLTSAYNRSTLETKLNQCMNLRSSQKLLALLFIDLDDFKNINDNYGHDSGDTVLKIVTSRLNQFLREKDFVTRMGGDEFIVVLNNIESKKDIEKIIKRTLELFRNPIKVADNKVITQTVSIGVSTLSKENDITAEKLLIQADKAMYKAKEVGKNTFHFFDKEND